MNRFSPLATLFLALCSWELSLLAVIISVPSTLFIQDVSDMCLEVTPTNVNYVILQIIIGVNMPMPSVLFGVCVSASLITMYSLVA